MAAMAFQTLLKLYKRGKLVIRQPTVRRTYLSIFSSSKVIPILSVGIIDKYLSVTADFDCEFLCRLGVPQASSS